MGGFLFPGLSCSSFPLRSQYKTGCIQQSATKSGDEIRKAQINKEVVVAVFFDVEKAYDMLWKEGLMVKLYGVGIRGRMLNWIWYFLCGRTIQVKIWTHVGAMQNRKWNLACKCNKSNIVFRYD